MRSSRPELGLHEFVSSTSSFVHQRRLPVPKIAHFVHRGVTDEYDTAPKLTESTTTPFLMNLKVGSARTSYFCIMEGFASVSTLTNVTCGYCQVRQVVSYD